MKLLLLLAGISLAGAGYGQVSSTKKPAAPAVHKPKPARATPKPAAREVVYARAEIAPSYKGNFRKFLDDQLTVPPEAVEEGFMGGPMILNFIVDTAGRVSDIEVAPESPAKHPSMAKVYIEIIKKSNGRWNPGLINGKPVKCRHQQSITICFTQDDDK